MRRKALLLYKKIYLRRLITYASHPPKTVYYTYRHKTIILMDVRVYTIGNGISWHSCLGCWWGDFKERLQKKGTELDGFYALYIVLQKDLGRR